MGTELCKLAPAFEQQNWKGKMERAAFIWLVKYSFVCCAWGESISGEQEVSSSQSHCIRGKSWVGWDVVGTEMGPKRASPELWMGQGTSEQQDRDVSSSLCLGASIPLSGKLKFFVDSVQQLGFFFCWIIARLKREAVVHPFSVQVRAGIPVQGQRLGFDVPCGFLPVQNI